MGRDGAAEISEVATTGAAVGATRAYVNGRNSHRATRLESASYKVN